jgi:TP901 family phage tail tape measure protein
MASNVLQSGALAVKIIADDKSFMATIQRVQGGFSGLKSNIMESVVSVAAMRIALQGLASPLQQVFATFTSFDFTMSKVQAITSATTEQIAKLREQAKELGRTTFFTSSQVGDAQKFLGMAGFSAEKIQAALPNVLNLALAGDMDIGVAADIATNISTPFNIAAKDLNRVNDVLAKIAVSSNTNVLEMGQAFKYAAPAAAAAGQSLEEVGAAFGILANNGLKADMAGTGVRMMLIKLADAGVQKHLKEAFNIDVSENGKIRDLMDVLRDIKEATSHLGNDEQISTLFQIFDARAGNAAVALSRAGDAIDEFRAKSYGAAGTATQISKTMSNNLKGDWIAFTSAIEGVQIAIGEAFNNISRSTVQDLTELTRNIIEFVNANSAFIVSIAQSGMFIGKLAAGYAILRIACKTFVGVATLEKAMYAATEPVKNAYVSAITAQSQAIAVNTAKTMENLKAKRAAIIAEAQHAKSSIGNKLTNVGSNITNLTNKRNGLTTQLAGVTSQKGDWQKELQAANVKAIRGSAAAQQEVAMIQKEINVLKTQEIALNQKIAATNVQLTAAEAKKAALTKASAAVNITMSNKLNAITTQQIALNNALTAATARQTIASKAAAVGTAAMSGAAKLATGAMNALKVSMMTNPMMWIAGAVAGLMALTYWLTVAGEKQAELSDAMGKKREEGDETRSNDARKFERLKQLANQEKLSNIQMKEAKTLAGELQGRYGDFGITMDETAGTINLAADAMDRFMESMNANAMRDMENELKEGEKNFKELQKAADGTSVYWRSVFANATFGYVDTAEDVQKRLGDQMAEQMEKNNEMRQKIARLKGGESALDVAKDPNLLLDERLANGDETSKEKTKQLEDAQKRLEDIRNQIDRERRSSLSNEIYDLKKRNEEYKKHLQLLIDTENAKHESQRDSNKISEWYGEMMNADNATSEAMQKLLDKTIGETFDPDQQLKSQQESEVVAAMRKRDTAVTTGNKSAIETAQKELEALKKQHADTQIKNIKANLDTAVADLDKAKQEYEEATTTEQKINAAQKVKEASEKVDKLSSSYEGMSEKQYNDKMSEINEQENEKDDKGLYSRNGKSGTFNAFEMASVQGNFIEDAMKSQLRLQLTGNGYLEKIYNELEDSGRFN